MDSDMITEKKTGKVRLRVETTPNPQPRVPIAEFEISKVFAEMPATPEASVMTLACNDAP
jgi:hypothetical protein